MFEFIQLLLDNLLFFALHFENAGVFPKPLNQAEEEECFRLMAQGDKNARSRLIEHNLRLVAHVAKKYYSSGADSDDLISIGTIGLIKAASSFDYTKGTRFATYAARCIDNEILMHFRSMKKSAGDIYFEEPVDTDKDGNQLTLIDIICREDSIVDQIDTDTKTDMLLKFMEQCLNEREREILILRYGLYGKRQLTQREVAKKLDISRSYVSRIEKKALETLRKKYERTSVL